MVRVRLLSDVHTELAPYSPSDVEADLVVLAGDIGKGVRGVQWATRWFAGVPVVYVPGNHEYYGGALPRVTEKMRAAAEGTNVAVLDRDAWTGAGVRVLGATLWTDFALFGVPSVFASSETARAGLNDYRRIRTSPRLSKLRPIDTQREHWIRAPARARGLSGATPPHRFRAGPGAIGVSRRDSGDMPVQARRVGGQRRRLNRGATATHWAMSPLAEGRREISCNGARPRSTGWA